MTGSSTEVEERCRRIRTRVLERLHAATASHLGTNMSMVEILAAIYTVTDVARISVGASDRDRVVISKGHSAAATYAALEEFGILSTKLMDTYHQSGSLLAGHVSHGVPGVEHSTGALGHGLSVALGMAIAQRSLRQDGRVFCVCGDGEMQEGSVWEALLLWRHLGLSNLVLLVDHNRISSITRTHDVIAMDPPATRFEGLGFIAQTVDGHDVEEIIAAILAALVGDRPTVIVCETVKGKGVSFAEHEPIWHYRSLTDELLVTALKDVAGGMVL